MNRFRNSSIVLGLAAVGITASRCDETRADPAVQPQSLPSHFAKLPGAIAPVSDTPIVVTKTLTITVTYDSNATTLEHCTTKDPNQALATLLLFDHAGAQTEVGRFTARDLWGGTSCNGRFNQSKTFPVDLKLKGQYILVITAFSALDHWHGGDLIITPRAVISADNSTAVDHSFPSPGGEQMINEAYSVMYK